MRGSGIIASSATISFRSSTNSGMGFYLGSSRFLVSRPAGCLLSYQNIIATFPILAFPLKMCGSFADVQLTGDSVLCLLSPHHCPVIFAVSLEYSICPGSLWRTSQGPSHLLSFLVILNKEWDNAMGVWGLPDGMSTKMLGLSQYTS